MPGKLFFGTKVVSSSGGESLLFSPSEFRSLFGREFSFSSDVVLVMNGDGTANGGFLKSAYYSSTSHNIWVAGGEDNNNLRVNYLVALGD